MAQPPLGAYSLRFEPAGAGAWRSTAIRSSSRCCHQLRPVGAGRA